MLDKSYYHGQQGECFLKLEKHFAEIKHEFDSQPDKTFLDPEDFSDSVRGLPDDFDDKSGDYVHSGKHWAYNPASTKDNHSTTIPCCILY